MNVGCNNTLNYGEATDGKLLADLVGVLGKSSLNGHTVSHLAGHKSLYVSGLICDNGLQDFLNELLEGCVLSNEVGLGVNLNDCGYITDGHDINKTLCGDSACLLCGSSHALLTKDLYSGLEVAVCILESVLAVHHAAAGLLSEFSNVFCGKFCHFLDLL